MIQTQRTRRTTTTTRAGAAMGHLVRSAEATAGARLRSSTLRTRSGGTSPSRSARLAFPRKLTSSAASPARRCARHRARLGGPRWPAPLPPTPPVPPQPAPRFFVPPFNYTSDALRLYPRAQVLLLISSERGQIYSFATPKLQPILVNENSKQVQRRRRPASHTRKSCPRCSAPLRPSPRSKRHKFCARSSGTRPLPSSLHRRGAHVSPCHHASIVA